VGRGYSNPGHLHWKLQEMPFDLEANGPIYFFLYFDVFLRKVNERYDRKSTAMFTSSLHILRDLQYLFLDRLMYLQIHCYVVASW
jgi:hypothetical protein